MIHVLARLFATLRAYRPGLKLGEAVQVELPDGATVADLAEKLGLPQAEIKLIFVNGLVRATDQVLVDGDEVGLFPPVGGG